MNKNIKQGTLVLENCESIVVPAECFKEFSFKRGENKEGENLYIKSLNCIIKDNGNMKYEMTYGENSTSPVQRLGKCNDITSVKIEYEDESSEVLSVVWSDDYNVNNNENQINDLVTYNELHIRIRSKLQTSKENLKQIQNQIKEYQLLETTTLREIKQLELLEAV